MTFAVPDSPVPEYDPVHEPMNGDDVDPVPLPPQPVKPAITKAAVDARTRSLQVRLICEEAVFLCISHVGSTIAIPRIHVKTVPSTSVNLEYFKFCPTVSNLG